MEWLQALLSKGQWLELYSLNILNSLWYVKHIASTISLCTINYIWGRCHCAHHFLGFWVSWLWIMQGFITEQRFLSSQNVLASFFFRDFPTLWLTIVSRYSDRVFATLFTRLEPHWRSFLKNQSLFTSSPFTAHTWRWWNDFWVVRGYEGHYRWWCIRIFYSRRLFLNKHTIAITIIMGHTRQSSKQKNKDKKI